MKQLKFTLLFMFAAVVIFSSCNSDITTDYVQKNKVVILNQGNYTEQNASVYIYDEDSKEIEPNMYSRANNGTRLGAALMSGTYSSVGAGYLLCANPDKIESVNILTMKTLGNSTSNGLKDPREIVIGNSYLFVTNAGEQRADLGNGFYEYTNSFVSIYDISNYLPNHLASVEVGSDAQGMIFFENKLFVATKDGVVVLERDGNNFFKGHTISDKNVEGAVKYLTGGRNGIIYASIPSCNTVLEINPYDEKVTHKYTMPQSYDGYITSDANGNVYSYATEYAADWSVVSSNIYKLDTQSGEVSKLLMGENFFSVGVSPYSGNLFASEANGFTTNSTMTITRMSDETHVATKTTGVGTFRYLFFSYLDVATSIPAN